VRALTRLRAVPAGPRRLFGFVAASVALHVATLINFPPAGLMSAPHRGAARPQPLDITLAPVERTQFAAATSGSPQAIQQANAASDGHADADTPRPGAKPEARMGVPGGADLPFPDKWYTASELDVRAEPLGEVRLSYPEELEGSGIPGRAHVLLFIDERGVVRKTNLVESEPARLFDDAALRAWADVRFAPAKRRGVAVKSQKLIELEFKP
jgi:TonB family protein